jgi:hypothetical protein
VCVKPACWLRLHRYICIRAVCGRCVFGSPVTRPEGCRTKPLWTGQLTKDPKAGPPPPPHRLYYTHLVPPLAPAEHFVEVVPHSSRPSIRFLPANIVMLA